MRGLDREKGLEIGIRALLHLDPELPVYSMSARRHRVVRVQGEKRCLNGSKRVTDTPARDAPAGERVRGDTRAHDSLFPPTWSCETPTPVISIFGTKFLALDRLLLNNGQHD